MKTKTIKLSDKQKEVIRLMREGWDLVDENILDRGTDIKRFSVQTISSLKDKEILKADSSFAFSYQLTELGKTIPI